MRDKSCSYDKGYGIGQTEVYVTVLTNDNYIRGVKALKQSLRNEFLCQ